VVDFKQAANNDPGFGIANIHWVNSILQANNSIYFEGMSVRQRVLFAGLPSTAGNHHSLLFRNQFTKGGLHAYDFLTSYAQAQAEDLADLGVITVLNQCGADIGPPSSLATTCAVLHDSTNFLDVRIPSDPFISKDGSTSNRITAYEAQHGPRTIRIYGDAPISNAALTLCHDVADGGDTGDSVVLYAFTWDSASSNILIEMAGHIAISGDGTGATWGTGLGLGNISGGSYHFKLDGLAGALTDQNCPPGQNQREIVSLGSQDNQLKGTSTLLLPPPCHISGASPVCFGATNIYDGTSFGPNLRYNWSVSGGGTILGSTTSSNVSVKATGAGAYTVSVTLTVTSGPYTTNSTCSFTATVNPPPPCSITGSTTVCPSSTNEYSAPPGIAGYSWSVAGAGFISGSGTNQTVNARSGSGCNTNFTLTLIVTDTNGCTSTCDQTVIVQDTTPPQITCPPPFNAAEAPRYSGGAVVNYVLPTATDNCTANPSIFTAPARGSLFPVGANVVTGTAVDECFNSNSCPFIVRVIPYERQVTSTDDSGPGTLRQALLDANDSPDENLVVLRLPGPGPYTIHLSSALPMITSPVIIDGFLQSGSNGSPGIELDGSALSNGSDGLVIQAGSSTVRGLALHGFATAIRLQGNGSNFIQGNFIGTDLTGMNAFGNSGNGIYIDSPNNVIGGTAPGTGNVISANRGNGIVIATTNATGNLIQGNLIGVAIDKTTSLSNNLNGVLLTDQSSRSTIGGTATGAENLIAFNGRNGITLAASGGDRNALLGNVLKANAGLGIDLGDDGVTPNDATDADAGPNDLQNFPVLTDAKSIEGITTITGQLTGSANTTFRVEFFLNDSTNASGYGEGELLLGSSLVTTADNGIGSFSTQFSVAATFTQFVTATATDPLNNSSEFSRAFRVRTLPILGGGPFSTNVPVGTTATLCTTVAGTPPIFYQWRINGVNIPGATDACYTVPSAQIADGGGYSVVIGNDLGALSTATAALTLPLSNIAGADNFADRVALTGTNGVLIAQNRAATLEPGEPLHNGKPGGKSIWYTWRAPATGVATFRTLGSTFDTLLAVYSGSVLTNLSTIDSDDDRGGFYTCDLHFNAFQGTQYQIAIDGFGGASGDFILAWQEQDTSHLLPIFLAQPASQTVAPGQTATFTVLGARVCGNGQINCDNPNPQLLYQWFFYGNPIPGATTNSLVITNVQPVHVGIYTVSIATPYQTNQSDDAVLQINLTGSEVENALASDKFLDATHPLLIGTSTGSSPLALKTATSEIRPLAAGSVVRGYTGTQVFNTTGSATSPGEVICGVLGGASDWISFVAEASGNLFLNTEGSSYDTVMAVFRRSPTNSAVLELLACDNNSGSDGKTSSLSVPVEVGKTNFILVDGVNGVSGVLQLNFSLATTTVIQSLGLTPQREQHLQVLGRPDLHFSIQASSNLVTWTSLIDVTNPSSGVFDYIDTNSINVPRRYYRALLLP